MKSGKLTSWNPLGHSRSVTGLLYLTLGWHTEGTWFYRDYFIWCVSCSVVVVTCFVMRGCFGNMCTCIYCVVYCLYCDFVLFRLCIFILICFVCTSVLATATKWKLNCSSGSGGGGSSSSSSSSSSSNTPPLLPYMASWRIQRKL